MQSYDSTADKVRIVAVSTGGILQHFTQEDIVSYLTIAFILYQFVITSPRAYRAARYWVRFIHGRVLKHRANRCKSQGG